MSVIRDKHVVVSSGAHLRFKVAAARAGVNLKDFMEALSEREL